MMMLILSFHFFCKSHFTFSSVFPLCLLCQVWMEICQAAFDSLLEGFSRVRKCSSEGRASMTMDVTVLHNGLHNIHNCRPPRGKHHVDGYIRASYLSEEEMMEWVRESWQVYAYRHLHGLLSQTLASVLNSKRLKDAVAILDGLYEVEEKEENKLSSLLSNRLRDDNKLTSMFGQRLRR